ncbi:MAG: selenium-dependent molybdenum cofactor biosynthesis protein YqeB [Johnsonella sp.]|nr:selenium-dependent molybdenum cofactor biosynthesis protein YqeB [Johnsonella sp.]
MYKFEEKLWIRGAGDLASGVAARLYRSGFSIIMSELPVPMTVRRSVAFSPAVYRGESEVEGIRAVFCKDLSEALAALKKGLIAVVADPEGSLCREYAPDILIDAIMAKKNLGTKPEDAGIVIALGPGFEAGKDCHAVIETKRGHNLGRALYRGRAEENTNIPGNIAGYDKERVIRAGKDGIFSSGRRIGDMVKKGELIAYSGEEPIYAAIDGVIRGLLQDGVYAKEGLKCGDIDPRGKIESCYTISDKAYAIAGGVLEAVLYLMRGREKKESRDGADSFGCGTKQKIRGE